MQRESLGIAVDVYRYTGSSPRKGMKKEMKEKEAEIRQERIKIYRALAKKHEPIGWETK
jgi:hypothetical protein